MKRIEMEDRVALPRVYLVWPSMPQYTGDEAATDTLATILGGGKSSRLYKSLVYERQIAQEVSAFNNTGELSGVFQIVATAKPGKTLAELEGAIGEEVERIKQAGRPPKNLNVLTTRASPPSSTACKPSAAKTINSTSTPPSSAAPTTFNQTSRVIAASTPKMCSAWRSSI